MHEKILVLAWLERDPVEEKIYETNTYVSELAGPGYWCFFEIIISDCCKQSLKWLLNPSINPATHSSILSETYFFLFYLDHFMQFIIIFTMNLYYKMV